MQTGKTGNQAFLSARFGLEPKHGELEADAEDQEARARLKEFKEFVLRGNVMDMAVGIIIGAAFSTIVKSLVDDIIMPPIGVITGGVDFRSFSFR